MKKNFSKRFGALALALAISLLLLVSCGKPSTANSGAASAPATSATPTNVEKEAPVLAEKVKSGELPELEKRLPATADVMVETMDSTGAYGSAITLNFKGKEDKWYVEKCTEEPLFRFTEEAVVEPNVAKGYDVNEDGTEFTIYLREGMKWSDGEPFTANDCVFFYEHMCLPEAFGKSLWDCFYSLDPVTKEKTACTMEVVNDTTFKVTFVNPNPMFLEKLAINGKWCFAPEHYCKEFLPEFIGEEAAEKKATELGYSDVTAMNQDVGYYFWYVQNRPTLRPWVATNDIDESMFIMKRNPYYWKTDADGRQLPYVDELHFLRFSEMNQKVLNTMSGELTIADGLAYSSIVTLKENEKKGNYTLKQWDTPKWASSSAALQLNQTVKDEKLRELFQNKSFRQALSIAADREEMAQIITDGFAQPYQSSPQEGMLGYDPEWSTKWTKYDPDAAKKLLEEDCGLVMGKDGYYTYADGSPLSLEILTHNEDKDTEKVAELLTEKYFKAVGIKASFARRERSLIEDNLLSNDISILLFPISQMETVNITLRPDTLVPVRNYALWYGTYGNWYESGGKEGLEPTGDIKKLLDLYDEMLTATTKSDVEAFGKKMLELHKENIWEIGYYSDPPILFAVNNDLRNFPEKSIYCDEFRGLGIAHFQNLYFETDKG